jgi:hypothetical protein
VPSKLKLIVNAKTANGLGITILQAPASRGKVIVVALRNVAFAFKLTLQQWQRFQ